MSSLARRSISFTALGAVVLGASLLAVLRWDDAKDKRMKSGQRELSVINDCGRSSEHPFGVLEVSLKRKTFRIPQEFLWSDVWRRSNEVYLQIAWPSEKPDAGPGLKPIDNRVRIRLSARSDAPVHITEQELERVIVSRVAPRVSLSAYPDILEYPHRRRSFYRAVDKAQRWADGMPSYFTCGGKPLSEGWDGTDEMSRFATCQIQLTWPDSFLMDIEFQKRYLSDWRRIHDSAISLVARFGPIEHLPISPLLD